jgi:SAM-dependent methyltransferase
MAPHQPAEFDAFAPGYDAGMSDPVKRLVGGSADTFLEHKAAWLLRHLPVAGRLLDFGCGTGGFLRALGRRGAPAELVGCDVASGMIEEARRRWEGGPLPDLRAVAPGALPFADAEFDLVTAVCVLHHIAPAERPAIARELLRVVRPGGAVVIFEHNPRNPLTRWMVARAPIDAHAVLLRAEECDRLLRGGGAAACRTEYLLFFPPTIAPLTHLERLLGRVPLGGQYVTVGTRAR